MTVKGFLSRNWKEILSVIGWFYYFLVTITFFNYITILMLAGITVALPTILLSFRPRNRQNLRKVMRRRLVITGFTLGVITLVFFPNIPRTFSQVYTRLDRIHTTITPDNPAVQEFSDEYIEYAGAIATFNSLSLRKKLDILDVFTQQQIVWTEDLITVLMAGDISTPEEAITRGRDDCRGQAVVMASVLIGLGFDAWVVEMAWHHWVMVYDENGVEYKLNHDGSKNKTRQYPIIMMWNDKEIRLMQDPIGWYNALMISSPAFYKYLFTISFGAIIFGPILGIGAALYSSICMGDYSAILNKNPNARRRLKRRIMFGTILFTALIGTLMILYFTPLVEFVGFYLFVYGMVVLVTLMNLEEFNEKYINKKSR